MRYFAIEQVFNDTPRRYKGSFALIVIYTNTGEVFKIRIHQRALQLELATLIAPRYKQRFYYNNKTPTRLRLYKTTKNNSSINLNKQPRLL